MISYNTTDYWGTTTIPANVIRPGDILKLGISGTMQNDSKGASGGIAWQMTSQSKSLFSVSYTGTPDLKTDLCSFRLDCDISFQSTGSLTAMTVYVAGGIVFSSLTTPTNQGMFAFNSAIQSGGAITNYNATLPGTLDLLLQGTAAPTGTQFTITNVNLTFNTSL